MLAGGTSSSPVEIIATRTNPPTSTSLNPLRCQQRQGLGTKTNAGFHDFLSLAHIAAAPANELACFDLRVHENLRALDANVFLHYDRIRACWNRRPGKKSNGFAGFDAQSPIESCRLLADDAQ